MAFLHFRRKAVEKKEPEAPARSDDPASPQQWAHENTKPDADGRRVPIALDDGHTVEEPGYGHGV